MMEGPVSVVAHKVCGCHPVLFFMFSNKFYRLDFSQRKLGLRWPIYDEGLAKIGLEWKSDLP